MSSRPFHCGFFLDFLGRNVLGPLDQLGLNDEFQRKNNIRSMTLQVSVVRGYWIVVYRTDVEARGCVERIFSPQKQGEWAEYVSLRRSEAKEKNIHSE